MGLSKSLLLEESDYKSLQLTSDWDKSNFEINNCDDHIYDDIIIGSNRRITGTCPVLKLTVLKDILIDKKSIISCNGSIVLEVVGDIILKPFASIMTYQNENGGEIKIKCHNLTLHRNASIKTANIANPDYNKKGDYFINDENKTILFGNISINAQNNIILNENSEIQSGDINIICNNSMTIKNSSKIDALRNDLRINIRDSLQIENKEIFNKNLRARNKRLIKHSKLEFHHEKIIRHNINNTA